MLTPPSRAYAWVKLESLKLIGEIFRVLGPYREPDEDLFLVLEPEQTVSFPLALAAALLSYQTAGCEDPATWLTPAAISRTMKAARTLFKISNDEFDAATAILTDAGAAIGAKWTLAQRKRFMARPTATDTRKLLLAIFTTGNYLDEVAELEFHLKQLAGVDCAPLPLITGDDLTAAGWSPGPVFKKVLDAVYDAQLEGRVTTKDDAMTLARRLQ